MIENETQYVEVGMNTKTIHFKRLYKAGLLDKIDNEFISDIQAYWLENYNTEVDPRLHTAIMNLTGKKERRFIPREILQKEVFPVFNDYRVTSYYGDKNIYGKIIKPPFAPKT